MTRLRRLAALLLIGMLSTGCGTKGELVLPAPAPVPAAPPATPQAEAPAEPAQP